MSSRLALTLCRVLLCRYFDNDCISIANGGVPETQALLRERYDHIFFTGSPAVGA